MIYTITFNPALDYIAQVENFKINEINRTKVETILPGGKGLNVSIVLKNLGIESTAIGFIADFTGEELKKRLEKKGIKTEFINVEDGMTRINIKICSEKNQNIEETALNGIGPQIMKKDVNILFEKIKNIAKEDIVILSGSIPKNLGDDIYERICKMLEERNVTFIVDSSKELLTKVLKYKPFLIKPNKDELEETINCKIHTKEDVVECAKKLKILGAKNVLVSLGDEGAVLLTDDNNIFYSKAPEGKVISTVGSGDSMVAGFLAGYLRTRNYDFALKMGVATGSASAFSTELASKEDVELILKKL